MWSRLGRDIAQGQKTTRIEALSDGVITIVITLLVLVIRVPGHEVGRSL
jgi:uncharacterized membrane protein